jgi:hypothetical protein
MSVSSLSITTIRKAVRREDLIRETDELIIHRELKNL